MTFMTSFIIFYHRILFLKICFYYLVGIGGTPGSGKPGTPGSGGSPLNTSTNLRRDHFAGESILFVLHFLIYLYVIVVFHHSKYLHHWDVQAFFILRGGGNLMYFYILKELN